MSLKYDFDDKELIFYATDLITKTKNKLYMQI